MVVGIRVVVNSEPYAASSGHADEQRLLAGEQRAVVAAGCAAVAAAAVAAAVSYAPSQAFADDGKPGAALEFYGVASAV